MPTSPQAAYIFILIIFTHLYSEVHTNGWQIDKKLYPIEIQSLFITNTHICKLIQPFFQVLGHTAHQMDKFTFHRR